MRYDFNLFNSIILTGIIQGFIFGIVVCTGKKYQTRSTLFLATLIVVFSLTNLQYYLGDTNIITTRELFGIIWFPGQLLSGPFLLFYGITLLHPKNAINKRTKILLLLPFSIALIIITYFKITMVSADNKTYMHTILQIEAIIEFLSLFLDTCIVIWLFFEIQKANRKSKDFGLTTVYPEFKWFRNLLIILFIFCFIWFYVAVLTFFGNGSENLWYIMWIALSIIIYWLGHIGIYKFGIHKERKKIRNHTLDRGNIIVVDKQKNEYLSSFEDLIIRKKEYLNPEITLDKVAEELKLSKSHLSRLINNELGISFPDYINQLRINEAKYYLKNPDFFNYTLIAIGLESGFASKTTFNNTFKKVTGMTPSEYKKEQNT
jgi:AraC-like DNA-binding protein